MRLVKIKLGKDQPFWFLENIQLTALQPESGFIDIDNVRDDYVDIINKSAKAFEIKLYDSEGNRIANTQDIIYLYGKIDTDDVQNDDIPEVKSVTIPFEEEQEEENEDPSPVQISEITDFDIKEAKILLSKNGNTIKKALKSFDKSKRSLVKACLELEKQTSRREGLIATMEAFLNGRQ